MVRLSTEEKAWILIRDCQDAHRSAPCGRAPRIRYARGWFTLVTAEGETTKKRGAEVREMTRRLRAAARGSCKTDEEPREAAAG